jgi:hypothetical protein
MGWHPRRGYAACRARFGVQNETLPAIPGRGERSGLRSSQTNAARQTLRADENRENEARGFGAAIGGAEMKKPLQVGDRVSVAGATHNGSATFYEPARGRVSHLNPIPTAKGMVQVTMDGESEIYVVHRHQCRRLVKRERRRVWVFISAAGEVGPVMHTAPMVSQGWAEFIEVKKK